MIAIAADITLAIIAILHTGFLVLEMFLWEKPLGRKIFSLSVEKASVTRVLAMNQGLYNGFLAAGLFWGLWIGNEGLQIKVFFALCVLVAGIFGAATVSFRIFWFQATPAIIALALLIAAY